MPRQKTAVRRGKTPTSCVPCWDKKRRELWFGKFLVKRFVVPAEYQEMILDAFQAEGWPACIDDPLPWHSNGQRTRLHTAIRHLNHSHANGVIRFHGNGKGTGIRWERV